MIIQIDFPENAVRAGAIEGSLYLTGEATGNFRPYNRKPSRRRKYKKLAHGKVSYDDNRTALCLLINHDEGVDEPMAIFDESLDAKMWLEKTIHTDN